ncbi:MAG: hypothetical protein K0R46_1891 [Herbinix sp.]|jgi:hypothetical protein|nr:hypothetical protein [Herbinix sp.]
MKNYVKPEIIVVDHLAEGIYASSGSTGGGCDSFYMNGIFVVGTYSPITDGYKVGRGCEGCPGSNGNKCKANQMSDDEDCRPTWEKEGKLPEQLGY